MAKAVRYHKQGGPEVLQLDEVPVGDPGPGQARMRHKAIGVNFVDTYQRSGLYPMQVPATAGNEGAGVVEAVGPGVTTVKPGERVTYTGLPGSYCDVRLVPAERLVRLPEGVSEETAASMTLKGMTVQYLIHRTYAVKPGDMVARDDVLIALSNSGESDELLRIVPLIKRQGAKLVAMTGNTQSTLAREADAHPRVPAAQLRRAMETVAEFDADRPEGASILRHFYAVTGGTIAAGGPGGGSSQAAAHLSDMALFLTRSEERGLPAAEITGRWRQKVGEIPGVESLVFKSNLVRMGANIDIQLAHEDFASLTRAAGRLKEELARYPGVGDIEDSYAQGKRELKIRLKPEARTLGITEEDLGRQVRSAFYGAESLRLQRGRNELKVMVRYPEESRRSLWDLEALRIRTPQGGEIPLARAAWVEEGRGFSEIQRTDRKRVINVTASVDSRQANAQEILGALRQLTQPAATPRRRTWIAST